MDKLLKLIIQEFWLNFFCVHLQSISCHYASADIDFIDVKGSIQDQVEKELLQMVEKLLVSKGVDPKAVTLKVKYRYMYI